MGWPTNPRPAKAITKLIAEVNALDPGRPKQSDGTLGDAAHATRDSDHNPWVKDGRVGVVTATDLTEDPKFKPKPLNNYIVERLCETKDSRVKYMIHEGKIWRSYDKVVNGKLVKAWTPSKYTGSNGHFAHLHVSVNEEKKYYDDARSWNLKRSEKPSSNAAILADLKAVRTKHGVTLLHLAKVCLAEVVRATKASQRSIAAGKALALIKPYK